LRMYGGRGGKRRLIPKVGSAELAGRENIAAVIHKKGKKLEKYLQSNALSAEGKRNRPGGKKISEKMALH